jgi:hypothetical protein
VTGIGRRRTWLAAQLSLIALAAVVAGFFTFVAPGGVSLVQRFTPATLGDQPPGAVVDAQEDGSLAVGIAVAPRVHGLLVVATVFAPDGGGATGLHPRFTITSRDGSTSVALGTPCMAGCYETVLPIRGMPKRAAVSFANGSRVEFALPSHGPSAAALALVREAAAEYKQIRAMVTYERLASSPSDVAYTTYYAVAPDRLRFIVRGEDESIMIGSRRWDRNVGGSWRESAQTPIDPITPYWAPLVQDATILGNATVDGQTVSVVSFADPQTPGFFTIWVDRVTHRTLELEMTAAAHFMHHTYGKFNSAISIQPPRSR